MSTVSTPQTRHSLLVKSATAALGLAMAADFSPAFARTVEAQPSATARAAAEDESVRPFHIHVPDEMLADLRRRIAATLYAHRDIGGGIGHNLSQEAPKAFADAVIDVARLA
ncbi:hydrolase [Caballeronia arationis]|jgi:pimeloyl-ACP methyl ester carboxylesterase|uniref:hypothetical protein n=1 Tax=Caballeronia arationis TaxID=1777142 RepID=UPI00074BC7DE|nr:hypothetical protein [Caballeronia arationis]SAK65366.1 hydrolase [Caballeronia arationis]